MKHTPGPWELVENGPAFNLRQVGEKDHFAILLGMRHNAIGELAANAMLLVTAPELLEAGRAAIRLCEMWERGQLKKTPAYTALKAAIAKVDGDHDLHG